MQKNQRQTYVVGSNHIHCMKTLRMAFEKYYVIDQSWAQVSTFNVNHLPQESKCIDYLVHLET